jgi:hypothetical protein
MGTTPRGHRLEFWDHFDLDIPRAITEQLVEAFEQLEPGSLTEENLFKVPANRGVYQLYRNKELVYVGKAEALQKRLGQHRFKILGRRNIPIDEIGFRCLSIGRNWAASSPEETLISHYQQHGQAPWNGLGFGNHDPGRNRDKTTHPVEGWDYQFPIRDDWDCIWIAAGEHNANILLQTLKAGLPYLLRYQKTAAGEPHPDYANVTISVPDTSRTAEALVRLIAQHLAGWQATRFPSKIILYKEVDQHYNDAVVIWPQ